MPDYEKDTSAFMGHEPCPECGSRDNLARYASGRGHCHGCGYNEWPDDDYQPSGQPQRKRMFDPIPGEVLPIASSYGINEATRSEEHTSELQSLMRISYAVFCLKKKKNRQNIINIHHTNRQALTHRHYSISHTTS